MSQKLLNKLATSFQSSPSFLPLLESNNFNFRVSVITFQHKYFILTSHQLPLFTLNHCLSNVVHHHCRIIIIVIITTLIFIISLPLSLPLSLLELMWL